MSHMSDHAAEVPDQPAPPVTVPEAESQSPLDIYAAYSPPHGVPQVGVNPHYRMEKAPGEKISVPIVVGAISIIVLLLVIYAFFNGLSNENYVALAA